MMILKNMLSVALVLGASAALAVNFQNAGGDIASNGADGWNGTMPGPTVKAQFNQNGTYTASADVEFGEVAFSANCTFDLTGTPLRTIKAAPVWFGWYQRSTTLKGGVWDLQGKGAFSAANDNGSIYITTLTLSDGCVVTNATMLRVGYKQRQNTLKITGASKVYTDAVNVNLNPTGVNGLLEVSGGGELVVLKGNFVDTSAAQASDLIEADTTNRVVVTGTGSRIVCPASIDGNNKLGTIIGNAYGRNSLEASDGGELYAPYRFAVGYSAMANNNTAVFKAGAKYYLSDFRIGENGSCGNHVEILSGANGRLATGYVGGRKTASHGNSLVIDSAELLCRQIIVSPMDGGYSNSLYIAGSDTSFTTTVTDLPNYPFVSRGRFNSFTLDGATWNYWLNMAIDDAAVSNEVRFVNGAQMLMGGGLFSGSDADASFGNRVTVSGGSLLKGTFVRISRKDNALVVSNAAVRAEKDGAGYIEIGSKLPNVDKANIADNALVLQGSAPKVSADKEIRFMNGSVFRIELPASGYGADHVPVVASEVSIDDTSRIEVLGVADVLSAWDGEPAVWTIVSAPGGITIPADVLAAANAQLSADSEGQLRLSVTDGGTRLVLKIGRRGLVLYLH